MRHEHSIKVIREMKIEIRKLDAQVRKLKARRYACQSIIGKEESRMRKINALEEQLNNATTEEMRTEIKRRIIELENK